MIKTVGSVCSGIEAASVAWNEIGFKFSWFSEIAPFPSQVLEKYYPNIANLGDMNNIPKLIIDNKVEAPDLICGGTPCQAFSMAGLQNGLNDDRGNLTLKFVDIIDANDNIRIKNNKKRTIVFWENVEGVLKDKTNAFGCLVSYLAGLDVTIELKKWPNAGIIRGPKRNVAWRLLDAKYFGVPQQRKRLYLLAGETDFYPENILFEEHKNKLKEFPKTSLTFEKNNHKIEVFREYTDCLYAAYGTKWNGNAAAYNGSLFVVQDSKIRRLTPIECERLMGFPDDYTNIENARNTNRYQATGNSWVVPVINWIGKRLVKNDTQSSIVDTLDFAFFTRVQEVNNGELIICDEDIIGNINCSLIPENPKFVSIKEIIDTNADEKIFLSPVGCYGIIRRKNERNIKINKRLEEVLLEISSKMDLKDIEKQSRRQKRGKFSEIIEESNEIDDEDSRLVELQENAA